MSKAPHTGGRPRVGSRVVLRLPDDLIRRIDRMRGDVPRAAYSRTLLEIALATLAPERQPAARKISRRDEFPLDAISRSD